MHVLLDSRFRSRPLPLVQALTAPMLVRMHITPRIPSTEQNEMTIIRTVSPCGYALSDSPSIAQPYQSRLYPKCVASLFRFFFFCVLVCLALGSTNLPITPAIDWPASPENGRQQIADQGLRHRWRCQYYVARLCLAEDTSSSPYEQRHQREMSQEQPQTFGRAYFVGSAAKRDHSCLCRTSKQPETRLAAGTTTD